MDHSDRTAEDVIAAMASRAHGVVTRRELIDAGLSLDQIRHRLAVGALRREYPGVYRAGHQAPDVHASYLAAVYACGQQARLAGLAAAHSFGAVKGSPPRPEVNAPTERRVPSVVTHRVRHLDRRDITIWHGIPTVTVARALVEIAGRLDIDGLARACHEAGARYRTAPRHVEDALSRRPNALGAAKLRLVMRGEAKVSLSRLESGFLRLLRREVLPLPLTNRPAGGRRVDCRWPAQGLTVELDSYRFHNSRHTWERDRVREREAYARGDAFRRYTWADVFERPARMLTELRAILA